MSKKALLLSGAFVALFSTPGFAAEVKYDSQGCYVGPGHLIQHADGFMAGSFDNVTMRLPGQNGSPLLAEHCVGSFMVIGGEPEQLTGVCEGVDPDGDKYLLTFARKGDPTKVEGTVRFVHGTGKYAGVTGEGKFKDIGENTPAPGVANTSGGCNRAWGTFTAPGMK